MFSMPDLLLYTEDLSNGWQPRLRAHCSRALVSMGLKDKETTMSCCFMRHIFVALAKNSLSLQNPNQTSCLSVATRAVKTPVREIQE